MVAFAVALTARCTVTLVDEPMVEIGPSDVRIRTLYSGISAGTELAAYRGTNPYLHKRWDTERRLFVEDARSPTTSFPLTSWGYEEVGEVIEVGPDAGVAVGELVYGTWGHRSHHVASGALARARVLPRGTEPLIGIFSHIGPTALNGVLDSAVRLGETAAVFGLGVVGQLCVQLLNLSGARVVGSDLLASRREVALGLGLEHVLDPANAPAAEHIKDLTGGRGADVCIEASGSTLALQDAIRACAYNGRVVALGFYQGQAQGLFLGEEFHHNRISVVCSQIGGIAPELQHRWDRQRLVQTFMDLATRGAVDCTRLVTHHVPVREAAAIYQLLDERPQDVMQAVLDFRPGA
jgi:2-desacetyl-2-hydroxyethyl bacteriochlorophyllide A dehydrogenase